MFLFLTKTAHMKVFYLFLIICTTFCTTSFVNNHSFPDHKATCSGGKNCHACKNCKYCKHCSKDGGTCSVCKKY